jgi:hypothetical protein
MMRSFIVEIDILSDSDGSEFRRIISESGQFVILGKQEKVQPKSLNFVYSFVLYYASTDSVEVILAAKNLLSELLSSSPSAQLLEADIHRVEETTSLMPLFENTN